MKKIAARLKELRLRNKLSQVAAASKVGICQQGWMRYESNGAMPGAEIIVQICSRFGVSADWLLCLTDDPKGISATIEDPALAIENERLEKEVAKLKEELIHLKGENAGLNRAIELLSRQK